MNISSDYVQKLIYFGQIMQIAKYNTYTLKIHNENNIWSFNVLLQLKYSLTIEQICKMKQDIFKKYIYKVYILLANTWKNHTEEHQQKCIPLCLV